MIGQLVGPIANLASSWLQGKADKSAATAKLKLVEGRIESRHSYVKRDLYCRLGEDHGREYKELSRTSL